MNFAQVLIRPLLMPQVDELVDIGVVMCVDAPSWRWHTETLVAAPQTRYSTHHQGSAPAAAI